MSKMVGADAGTCAGCGAVGYRANTASGEVIGNGGQVIATVPAGGLVLLAGMTDGTHTDDCYCEDCAEAER